MPNNDNEKRISSDTTPDEHHGQDLTRGPIGRQLWQLAWPIMLSIFFYTLYNIVDTFWVSKISAEAIAAVSISQIALFIMVALSMGITVGSGVVMSMHIGAKNIKEAERILGQSFVLSGILALFFTVISLIWREPVLIASGASGLVFAPALEYFTITAAGSILIFIMMTIVFAYNAQGDNFTTTKLFAVSTLVNTILDPILIFGWFGLPELGIAGAAIATLISQAIFIIIAMYFLASEKMMIPFRLSNLTIRLESVKKVLNIGLPAALTQVINPIGAAALLFITARSFAEAGTVAFSIGFRIEFFAYLPAIGFGFGSMALIGQNMGAGNFTRAREAFNKALIYGIGTAIAIGFLAILAAPMIAHIFTTDPIVTQYVNSYILYIALSYGFLAAMMVVVSGFQAIGRSWPGFWLYIIRFTLVSIPVSYLLTIVYDLPIESLWIAIAAGNVVSALVGYLWIMRTFNNMKEIDVPVHPEQPVVI